MCLQLKSCARFRSRVKSMETSTANDLMDCYKLYGCSWDECGYCHGARAAVPLPTVRSSSSTQHDAIVKTYRSYYAQATSAMKPSSYEILMCRGWRRSGTILYLPNNAVTCCPQHTIRLPISEYQPNKEQKKVIRKMHNLLEGRSDTGKLKKNRVNDAIMTFLAGNGTISMLTKETESLLNALLPDYYRKDTTPRIRYKMQWYKELTACVSCPICSALVSRKIIEKKEAASLANTMVQRLQSSQSLSNFVSTISCTTAGIIQIEIPIPEETLQAPCSDPLEGWFRSKNLPVPNDRTIRITTISAVESASLDARVHKLFWDYQAAVHNDKHPLVEASTEDSVSSIDMIDPQARAMLERTYEGKSIPAQAFSSFWDFLVESPLGLSTVHQQYTIGEALVAVGVLDILPTGVSSVYCFYDPSFSKLVKLGSYAAIKEIEYTRSLKLSYYYLGYFIESNPKMNYKGDYVGSEIRCSTTGEWVGVERARQLLRADERATLGSNHHPTLFPNVDVGNIPLLTSQGIIYGSMLQESDKKYLYPFLEEWAGLAGPEIATTGTIDMLD